MSQRLGDVVEEDDVALLLRYKGKAVAAASVIVFGQDHARVRGRGRATAHCVYPAREARPVHGVGQHRHGLQYAVKQSLRGAARAWTDRHPCRPVCLHVQVQSLVTAPGHERRGHARALLQALEQLAGAAGECVPVPSCPASCPASMHACMGSSLTQKGLRR